MEGITTREFGPADDFDRAKLQNGQRTGLTILQQRDHREPGVGEPAEGVPQRTTGRSVPEPIARQVPGVNRNRRRHAPGWVLALPATPGLLVGDDDDPIMTAVVPAHRVCGIGSTEVAESIEHPQDRLAWAEPHRLHCRYRTAPGPRAPPGPPGRHRTPRRRRPWSAAIARTPDRTSNPNGRPRPASDPSATGHSPCRPATPAPAPPPSAAAAPPGTRTETASAADGTPPPAPGRPAVLPPALRHRRRHPHRRSCAGYAATPYNPSTG